MTACPRCGGNLRLERDEDGDLCLHCLQCGFTRTAGPVPPLILTGNIKKGEAYHQMPKLPKTPRPETPQFSSINRGIKGGTRGHPLTINGRKGSKYSW